MSLLTARSLAEKLPFSWEKKPGVCEVTHAESVPREHEFLPKLPPPPCTAEGGKSFVHDLQIPLPPCTFQPPYYRTSSKRDLWMQDDDPFLAAYIECQKSTEKNNKLSKTNIQSRFRKIMSIFSCKQACPVRDDNLVRISDIPHNI